MARIRTLCGKDLDSMEYVSRHLPRCAICLSAHALQQRQRINITDREVDPVHRRSIEIARRISG